MYPETDIPPIQLTEEYVNSIRQHLPELPEQRLQRLMRDYGLNQKLAQQLMDSEYLELFEEIAKENRIPPTTIAAFLTETLKALKREGTPVERLTDNHIREIFKALRDGEITKEALPEIASWLAKNENRTVKEAVESLGLKVLSRDDLEKIVDQIMSRNKSLIERNGQKAFGPIMGMVMKEVRGRANAEVVGEIINRKLAEAGKIG
jgi:glutamyl-tRNA(Gln) amidotransferase subunit E